MFHFDSYNINFFNECFSTIEQVSVEVKSGSYMYAHIFIDIILSILYFQ